MSTSSNVYTSQQLGGSSSSRKEKRALEVDMNTNQQQANYAPSQSTHKMRPYANSYLAMSSNTNQQQANYGPSQFTDRMGHYGGPMVDYEQPLVDPVIRHVLTILVYVKVLMLSNFVSF